MKKLIALILMILMMSSLFSANGIASSTPIAPFTDVNWDATYQDMLALGLEASDTSSDGVMFSPKGLEVTNIAGLNFQVMYSFSDKKLKEVGATGALGTSDAVNDLFDVAAYLEKFYGGKFDVEYQWASASAEINYGSANRKQMGLAVANGELTCVGKLHTRYSNISITAQKSPISSGGGLLLQITYADNLDIKTADETEKAVETDYETVYCNHDKTLVKLVSEDIGYMDVSYIDGTTGSEPISLIMYDDGSIQYMPMILLYHINDWDAIKHRGYYEGVQVEYEDKLGKVIGATTDNGITGVLVRFLDDESLVLISLGK